MAGYGEIEVIITEYIGVLATRENGWRLECNMVSWNGAEPKVDIREWSPDHTRMARGIKMSESEAEKLAMCLGRRMMNRQKAQKEKDSFER